MPQVTVLMPVFNGAKFLEQAIASILSQSFRDFEFIVIDDASHDATPAILKGCHDPRFITIRNEQNLGLTRSLNTGLRMARGEFIARMDADDLSMPERLEVQTAYLRSHPEVGLVCSAARIIDKDDRPVGLHAPRFSPEHLFFFLNFKNCIVHSSVLFRRETASRLGGYNERLPFAQDYEFWCRFSKTARIFQLDQELVCWRQHKGSISAGKKELQDQAAYEVVGKNLRQLTGRQISRDELTKMQYECPENENDLTKIVSLLARIRRGLLKQESGIIKALQLNAGQIRRIANDSRRRLLYRYFRRLKFMEYPGFFIRVGARHFFLLGREIILAVTHKVIHGPAR